MADNIVNLRIYTLKPRATPEYLRLFREHGLALQLKYLGAPLGYYQSEIGPLNQIVHLWGYESLADMEARRGARNADPAWKAYGQMNGHLVDHQEDRVLRKVELPRLG
ncbi:MAG: NIPSNAP family protein [Alphaproteobacteria bacterium]|nr:NIPSNAP family protein [Alphaproteobacteria bacterium]